jgi:hypothetical protein
VGTALATLGGSTLCIVLGWFLRRLVSQIDISIARLQKDQEAETRERTRADSDLRDRVQNVANRQDKHDAEHMLTRHQTALTDGKER